MKLKKTLNKIIPYAVALALGSTALVFGAGIHDSDTTDSYDQPQVVIRGGTDNTAIGNTGDALHVAIGGFSISDSIQPFDLAVAKGTITGHRILNKFGSNQAIKSTAFESIWTYGSIYVWPTAAQTLNCVSTSTNDVNTTGTGAWQLKLTGGLDTNFDEIADETLNLNGTTNVTTSNSYIRLPRMVIIAAGSLGYNEGEITCTQSTSGIVIAAIDPQKNQTLMAIWTVPNNHTLYLTSYYFTSENSQPAVVEMYARPFGEVFQIKHRLDIGSSLPIGEILPFKFIEKTDIDMRGLAQTGQHRVAAGFSGYIVED
jgi:hypothetical protein